MNRESRLLLQDHLAHGCSLQMSQDPTQPQEVKKYRMKCDSYLLSADFFTLTHKIVQPLRLAVKVIPAVLNQIQEEGESVQ